MTTPKLSAMMQKAGIKSIGSQNFNGSFVCEVELSRIDLKNTQANPRTHSKSHGEKIKSKFRKECVRNPVLQYKKGHLTSIDGRHTAYALLDCDENAIWTCDVHFKINDKIAARIFHDLTVNNKRIGTWDAHACALQAEMIHAVDIQNALDEYGFSTPNDPGFNNNTADFKGYTVLQEAWNCKNSVLSKLLYIVFHCFTLEFGVDPPAKNTEFMRGLLDLITDDFYEEMPGWQMVPLLKRRTASEITEMASDFAQEDFLRGANRGHFYRSLEHVMALPVRRVKAA